MSKPKVHYGFWLDEPSESDPDGWEEVMCGRDDVDELSHNPGKVTCKNCLRRMAQRPQGGE